MEDKVFELITKMYSEMQEIKSNMATKDELQEMKSNMATKDDIQELKSDVTMLQKDVLRMEDKLDNNSKALFDGYKQSIEGIADLKNDIKVLTEKVENHEVKLRVVK